MWQLFKWHNWKIWKASNVNIKTNSLFTDDEFKEYPQLRDIVLLFIGGSFLPIDNDNGLDLLIRDKIYDIIWFTNIPQKQDKMNKLSCYMDKYFSLVSELLKYPEIFSPL